MGVEKARGRALSPLFFFFFSFHHFHILFLNTLINSGNALLNFQRRSSGGFRVEGARFGGVEAAGQGREIGTKNVFVVVVVVVVVGNGASSSRAASQFFFFFFFL